MKGAVNQHKQMAMGGNCYKNGGSIKSPVNFGPPKADPSAPPPKTGFNKSPITKMKRANGIKDI